MKNLFNKKFMPIICLLLVFITLFTSNVFASFDFTVSDTDYSIDIDNVIPGYNSYNYHIFVVDNNLPNILDIYCFNNNIVNTDVSNVDFQIGSCYRYYFQLDNLNNIYGQQSLDAMGVDINNNLYFYSDTDLINSNGDVVFQVAPQGQETILAPIVEQAETDKVMAEIVGILPVIMIILVSIIAIWKALKLLRNVLKTS